MLVHVTTSGVVANLELGERSGSVYSSRPSVEGNSGTWPLGGQRGAEVCGPKIEAYGRGRRGVLGEGAASAVSSPSGVWGGAPAEIEFWHILA